ncbi:hypothetical protein NP493_7674g00000 [Ridgeia piscesae]|uniref:Uncharacterized protein n=1 Tax=Ridgeia piscesae TaxID=27915 RepID=A0AAD9ML19_RIDPI|nr:hypothetical protein NP493_7674g00002 [Ridgeia piscesae]KAK2138476.1 hypothetical protein NP493_7674g00000 [Ridgeia piscesae]
MVPRSSAETG